MMRANRISGILAQMYSNPTPPSPSFSNIQQIVSANSGLLYAFNENLGALKQNSIYTGDITSVGQGVGYVNDYAYNYALGAERITNGDFSNGTTGWSWAPATVSSTVVGGRLEATIIATSAVYRVSSTGIFPTVGKSYAILATLEGNPSNTIATAKFGLTGGLNANGYSPTACPDNNAPITIDYRCIATSSTSSQVRFEIANATAWGAIGDSSYLDNVSVREVLGTQATQATQANKPLLTDISGRFGLSFNGTSHRLDMRAAPAITNSMTITWAGSVNNLSANRFLVGAVTSGGVSLQITTLGEVEVFGSGGQLVGFSAVNFVTTQNAVYSVVVSPSVCEFYLNGVLVSSSVPSVFFTSSANLILGANGAQAQQYSGNLAMFSLVPSSLTTQDRLQVERYAGSLIGVTIP